MLIRQAELFNGIICSYYGIENVDMKKYTYILLIIIHFIKNPY